MFDSTFSYAYLPCLEARRAVAAAAEGVGGERPRDAPYPEREIGVRRQVPAVEGKRGLALPMDMLLRKRDGQNS